MHTSGSCGGNGGGGDGGGDGRGIFLRCWNGGDGGDHGGRFLHSNRCLHVKLHTAFATGVVIAGAASAAAVVLVALWLVACGK